MKKQFKVYKVEVGILLKKNDREYKAYNCVYDKKHAFYDENVAFFLNEKDAINYGDLYVAAGVNNTYCVVSELLYDGNNRTAKEVKEDINTIKGSGYIEEYNEKWYEEELYSVRNVIHSSYKKKDKVIYQFITK